MRSVGEEKEFMNDAFYVGAVGLDAQQQALDVIANNIANINTSGFKRSEMRFSEVMSQRVSEQDAVVTDPVDLNRPSGVVARAALMVEQQGDISASGNPRDLAINGAGFIELIGADNQTVLWRGGALLVDDNGYLAAENRMILRTSIVVPDDISNLFISANGEVSGTRAGEQDPVSLGQIDIVRVTDPQSLGRMDGGFYAVEDLSVIDNVVAGENGMGIFVQGAIENSNVELSQEMVNMLLVQRAFASNAQILQAADEMMGISNNLRR